MLSLFQLETIYRFMSEYERNPRISLKQLHKKYKPYQTITSTRSLVKEAKDTKVLLGPRLFLNAGLDVELYRREDLSLWGAQSHWNRAIHDPIVRYAILLGGAHTLLLFKRGATVLTYAKAIKPSFPKKKEFSEINPIDKGKVPHDPYPKGWDDLDWSVYEYMKHPSFSYVKVGKKLDVSWQTVKNRFKKILKDCKTWNSFFPRGLLNYYHVFMTFTTDYEIGLERELEKLDRTTFFYKFNDMILLYGAMDNYEGIARFGELEKEGIIHDLRVSNPIQWHKPDVLD